VHKSTSVTTIDVSYTGLERTQSLSLLRYASHARLRGWLIPIGGDLAIIDIIEKVSAT
jgi:hypothetical protein